MTSQVRRLAVVLPALLLFGSVRLVWAQSLADVAKQEEERRKTIKQPGKVYTNKDLHTLPPVIGGTVPDTASASAEGSAAAEGGPAKSEKGPAKSDKGPEKGPDQGDTKAAPGKGQAKDQAYWAGRLKGLKAALDRDQTLLDAMQSRINALTADFVNRGDPAQRAVIAQNKQKALDELDRLKKAIQDDKKALSDLEDEARRAGVPPGWLRS